MTPDARNNTLASEQAQLSEGDVERIASRVVELLASGTSARQSGAGDETWVKADAIARRFGVSRGWVYENAGRLGAIRLSECDRAQLRFNPDVVQTRLKQLGAPVRNGDEPQDDLAIHRPRVRRRQAAR